MRLIIALGNPGREYQNSRHNIGFILADKLQEYLQFKPFVKEQKFKAEVSMGNHNEEKIILVKPLTFMNLSGESVRKFIDYYKISTEDCLVICDDLDTPFLKIRLKSFGGPGTHNGLKSVVNHIGEKFPRLRIGIESRGELAPIQTDTSSFVLGNFTDDESNKLPNIIDKALKATLAFLEEGIDTAMNKFNN